MKNNKFLILFGIFILALLLFSIFSTKVLFSDVSQYIGAAKEFAGISTAKARNFNSWVYPLFISPFLKIFQGILTFKLLNIFWLILDGFLIYYITKKRKAFLLFIFSPIVWYTSSWINPILPVSFLLLLSYQQIKQYEKTNNKHNFIISALSLGIASSLWWAATYISIFFILAFFYNKKLLTTIFYIIPFLITFSIRLLIDSIYFGFPFFTILRNIGSNLSFLTGTSLSQASTSTTNPALMYLITFISLLFIVSPLFYKLFKLNFKEYKFEIIFLGLTTLLFLSNLQLRYFITITPIIFLLIAKYIRKKELIAHIIISLIVIIIFTTPYFGQTQDSIIIQDINQISSELPNESFIVGAENLSEEQALFLSTLYSGNNIKEFIRYSEYKLSLTNQTKFRDYTFSTKSKINNLRKIDLNIIYSRTDSRTYEDINYWIIIGKEGIPPKEFKLLKEYQILRLFKKE